MKLSANYFLVAIFLACNISRTVQSQLQTKRDNVAIDSLARDLERVESVREVKDVQRTFAQFAQFGRWADMATLFSSNGTLRWGTASSTGHVAIQTWLRDDANGMDGIQSGSLDTMITENPLITLSADGKSAKGRWNGLRFMGDGKGGTRIQGGIYENEYVQTESGWKISLLHYYALYAGPYVGGWRNVGGGLPVVPYHFTAENAGAAVSEPIGEAPQTNASLGELAQRIERLNDEDEIRNLQHVYGYYVDRRMWTDVVDLFAPNSTVNIRGAGSYLDSSGVRQAMERMGREGLSQGILNDHPIFGATVNVLPGGVEAIARGIEVGMTGDANSKTASWEFSVFRNTFVKQEGLWRFQELNVTPLIKADYFKGWGDGGSFAAQNASVPFLDFSPRRSRQLVKNAKVTINSISELARLLARSSAWDGTENVSSAYGYLLDDLACPLLGAIHASKGNKLSPFTGWYATPERITTACSTQWGTNHSALRSSISFHWRPQPVILVSDDGRSSTLRARLLQPSTSIDKAGSFNGAMYHDQMVLEEGKGWKLWSVTIDEFYWMSKNWAEGWATATVSNSSSSANSTSSLAQKYPPDLTLPEVGDREASFRGGSDRPIEWPEIQRMWFQYRNPVSGRMPEYYWPGCVPCRARPEWALEANGYQEPPTGPPLLNTTGGVSRRQTRLGNKWNTW
ncbi:uncharacterized protein E0L32_005299 [Thyridium curvatum]|uniref:SnoaL-like domain-containing protein n=1 Tax=Thyridium curvatum TaxID=1093900 RepID=A0A507B4D7_9PEZI|nr:uncharacterized protein E0L32_005299 [Thyridium curvatum]TPX14607.1 hypothetical protein E0L32_005299 [Thyridium curvatum]